MGTIWMTKLFRKIASLYQLSLQISNNNGDIHNGSDILIANHSQLSLHQLKNYVGSHLIRDPRDAIVSGYFYHLWTNEAWAQEPQEIYGGQSYQQHLKGLTQEDGLVAEIERFRTYIRDYRLMEWDYQNPRIYEVKYESLIADEQQVFEKMFRHFGFHETAIRKCLKLAKTVSFANVAKRDPGQTKTGSHLRSGRPNQWVDVLNDQHRELIKSLWGDLIIRMGYEVNNDW